MIPLTGDEIRTLVEARDLLQRKGNEHSGTEGMFVRNAYAAILTAMKNAYVDVETFREIR